MNERLFVDQVDYARRMKLDQEGHRDCSNVKCLPTQDRQSRGDQETLPSGAVHSTPANVVH